MKVYTLKNILSALALICLVPAVNAQFDDVYYDPDNVDLSNNYANDGSSYDYDAEEDVTYYDDDEYEYYDDYDFYYTSRIRRFYRPYSGFDFYDPYYVSYNYYDPFYTDAYYYPGASIYISFGNADYWSYRNWRRWSRWNRWNSYNSWNNWCLTPSTYYYSYNSWCSPSHNYWGGHYGNYGYSNYYNNYYNSCPSPVSNYYGITHSTVNTINNGGTRGTYYGPRITGNTGSSPRGPVTKPEYVQPVFSGANDGLTQSNEPKETGGSIRPGVNTPSTPVDVNPRPNQTSEGTPKQEKSPEFVRNIPVDKELNRDEVKPSSGRPVFRPYPSNDRPSPDSGNPTADQPASRPTPEARPTPTPRESYTPRPSSPQYEPAPRNNNDRPSYSPPSRNDDKPSYTPRNEDRPSYSPPARNDRSDDRPSYTPPARNNDRSNDKPSYTPAPRNNDSGRSNDRPSYSPPSRNDSSSGSRSSSPSPQTRENSSSRSNSSSGSSPRSPGRG